MPFVSNRKISVLLASVVLMAGCVTGPAVGGGASTERKPAQEPSNALQVSDVSIPPGSKLDTENSLIIGTGDRWLGRLVVKTDQTPVQAYNHIYNGMPGYGWSLIAAVQSKVSNMTYLRGERVASIQIEPSSLGGSQVAITVSARQGTDPVRAAGK